MNRVSTLNDFLQALRGLCERMATCTVVFIPGADAWGKIGILQGQILSVRYQSLTGLAAAERLATAEQVQYNVRMEEPLARKDHLSNITNTEFFGFFRMPPPHARPSVPRTPAPPAPPAPGAAPTAPRPAASANTPPLPRKKRILVVDDSRVSRKFLCRVLTEGGYLPIEAESGFDALGQMGNQVPDLVLLDLVLPDIDGYKVLESIKRHNRYQGVPVFILTGRDSLLDRIKGKISESDEYLLKPVDGELLLKKLEGYLGGP